MKYDEAFNNHDPAAVAALYTEDGVFMTMKSAMRSRSARNIDVIQIGSCRRRVLRFDRNPEPAERGSFKTLRVSGCGLRFIMAYSQRHEVPPRIESNLGQI